ncbi:MAG: N-acetyl sugar amidotransferase [Pseudomonadota bacterium]
MKYCPKCLQPDTRPNTEFTDTGICPACSYHAEHSKIDWAERRDILLALADHYRNPSAQYDCIIGVSGGKDSTRQALWVRDYLKLRPLLVCLSYPPEQITDKGVKNLSNLVELGFDLIQSCPAPITWQKLMRAAFDNFANWAKATELALFSAVPQLAIQYKIPLILWGENPGLQLGDMATLGPTGYDGNNLRHMNTLAGGSNDWMREAGFSPRELIPYTYPTVEEFAENDIQIVYLGWFLGDWSLLNNGMVSSLNGLHMRDDEPQNTGDLYGVSSLDEDWVTLNQMIKYYKFGFGRATDYANELIRMGVITRERGIVLVEKYDGVCSEKYISDFCQFIDISTADFWTKVRSVTNAELFDLTSTNAIKPRFTVGEDFLH